MFAVSNSKFLSFKLSLWKSFLILLFFVVFSIEKILRILGHASPIGFLVKHKLIYLLFLVDD